MIIKKEIEINKDYKIIITYHDNNDYVRYYRLENNNNETLTESYNRDAFLLKVNKIVKLTNKIECLIASY